MIRSNRSGGIATITMDRPAAHNALSREIISAMAKAIDESESDMNVKVIILTGTSVFCTGADIGEMSEMSLQEALVDNFSGCCERLAQCNKPLIAAVEGYAIGGGCELVEMCDIVVSGDSARFGHPEITLGTLSGAGGTQRLARAVGRAKAMDLILSGRLIDAVEAEKIGLISRVVPSGTALEAALEIAEAIEKRGALALQFAKEAVDLAVSHGLEEGLRLERRLFHLSFATAEFQDGMRQFLAKRATNRQR